MPLERTLPAPVTASRFRTGVEEWSLAVLDGTAPVATLVWAAVSDAASAALDITGACQLPAGASAQTWFFAAPAPIVAAVSGLEGGLIAFASDVAPAATGAAVQTTPDVVLRSAGVSLGLRLSGAATSSPRVAEAWLTVQAGWVDLSTGDPATASTLHAVLSGLTGLLVRGGPSLPGAPTSLFTVELYQAPLHLLETSADAWFEDGALTVEFTPSAFAAGYEFTVSDAQGNVVLTKTVPQSAVNGGRVSLASTTFQPAEGASYTIRMWAIGPNAPDSTASFVQLAAPNPTAAPGARGVHLSWATVSNAVTYDLQVTFAAAGAALMDRSGITATAVDFGSADGLVPATDYSARVRARAGTTRGPWSNGIPVRLPSMRQILQALLDRMNAHPTASAIPFDTAVLPQGTIGAPSAILDALTQAFGAAVTITVSAEPALTDTTLTLDGTTDLLGDTAAGVQAVFTVENEQLQLLLTLTPTADWRLSDAFDLAGTVWDELLITGTKVIFATTDQTGAGIAVKAGLNLVGDLIISKRFERLRWGDTPPADALRSRIGGAIRTGDAGTFFTLEAPDVLGDVDLAAAGLPIQTITGGRLTLSRTAAVDGTPIDTLEIGGSTKISGSPYVCTIDVPTIYTARFRLALTVPPAGSMTVATALSLGGQAAEIAAALSPWFGTVPIASVDTLIYRFDPVGAAPVDLVLSIGLRDSWSFTSAISIERARLDLRIIHYPGTDSASDAASFELSGQVIVAGQPVDITAVIRAEADWTISFATTPPVTLAGLAGLAGFDGTTSFAAFPSALTPATSVGLSEIVLEGRPNTSLTRAQFKFVQTRDWSVGNVITLSDAQIVVAVDVAQGVVVGYFQGAIVLGSGAKAVRFSASGPVPPAVGEPWTIQMLPGQEVTVPSLSDLTGLFGGASPSAPPGTDQISALVIDRLLVRFDPAASPVLRQIALSVKQSGAWTIVGPNALVLSGAYGRFDYDNAGSDLVLDVGGTISVLGTAIDARFSRTAPGADWTLLAQTGTPVPSTGGISALDSWMQPAGISGYVGDGAPFTGPTRVGGVQLQFSGADGTLKQVVVRLALDLGWTLIPDKLTIDGLSAVLMTSMPVSTASWTGTVTGDLTVFGAPIILRADKPTPTSNWRFRGELAKTAPIDLAQSAGSLTSGTSFALPAGLSGIGAFPSAITITSAEVDAIPGTGYFRFAGAATFTDWNFGFGALSLQIRSIGGEILVKKSNDPLRVRVTGALAIAGAHAEAFVQLGNSATVDTVVAGVVSPASIGSSFLESAVDSVAGTGIWSGAPLPQGFTAPSLTSAAFYLNLTSDVMALYGRAGLGSGTSAYAAAALLVRKLPASPNSTDSAGASNSTPPSYGYAFVLNVEGAFLFADLVPTSSPIHSGLLLLDAVITLKTVSLTISSFDQLEGSGNPFAALATIDAQAAQPDPSIDQATPPQLPAPPTLPAADRIGRGLNLYGKIAFEGALWTAVKFVLDLTDAELTVQATLNPSEPAATLFLAELANATLLGYLHFAQLRLKYQSQPSISQSPPPAPYLAIGGDGTLAIPGTPDIAFTGWVIFDTKTDASGEAARAATFDATINVLQGNLLGIPRVSLTLSSIKMAWTLGDDQADWKRTQFSVTATATLGGLTLDAKVDLSVETQQSIILSLDTTHTLSLQHLLVNWLGVNWLDGAVPDLGFSNGSLVWTKPQTKAATYTLHAEASLIGFNFLFEATLSEGDGFTGSAALASAIDFGFVKLAGPGKANGPKASLTSTTASKTMALDSVVTLLGHDFTLHLAYSKPSGAPKPVYSGSVATELDFGQLGSITPEITLTYSESGGLDVKIDSLDIPWDKVKTFLNFVEKVKAAYTASNDPCQSMADLVLAADAVKLTFDCALAFPQLIPQSGASPASIKIDLVFSYAVYLAGIDQPVHDGRIVADFLEITIPSDGLTFANVAESLIIALVGAAPNIVASFFSDPEAMAKFTAMLIAQQAGSAVISSAVCRRTTGPSTEANNSNSSGSSSAASGDWTGAIVAFVTAFSIAGAIISFLEDIWDSLTGEDKKKREKAEEQQAQALAGIASLVKPTAATISFTGRNMVVATCVPPAGIPKGNGATYGFDLFRMPEPGANGSPVQLTSGTINWQQGDPNPSIRLTSDGVVPGATYQISVKALIDIHGLVPVVTTVVVRPYSGSSGGDIFRGFTIRQAESLPALSQSARMPDCAMASLSLEQVGGQVAVVVVAGNEAATSVLLQWVDQNGQVVAPNPAAPAFAGAAAGTRHEMRLVPPVKSGTAILRATASVGQVVYQTSSSALQVIDLPAPVLSPPRFNATSFSVDANWNAVQGAGGYRLRLFDDGAVPALIGETDAATALEGRIPAGTRAGFVATVRVAALPASGPGAVWGETQSVIIPGSTVTLALAQVASGQSANRLAFSVRQLQPPSSTILILSPGDSGKTLGSAPVATFSAERAEELAAGANIVRQLSYALKDIRPSISLSAPLTYDWPVPDGTSKTTDWALELPGGARLWHRQHAPMVMAIKMMDALPTRGDRLAIATALDAVETDAGQRNALFALQHDPEAMAATFATANQTLGQLAAAMQSTFGAIGQPLDVVSLARLLVLVQPGAAAADLADVLDAKARADATVPTLLAAAYRVAGMEVKVAIAQLHRLRGDLSATQLAQAVAAAYYRTDAVGLYAKALAATVPASVLGARVASLAAFGAGTAPANRGGLVLLLALLRARGFSVGDAAIRAHAALPSAGASALAVAMTTAYYDEPTGLPAAVSALALALALGTPDGTAERLAWALVAAGVATSDLSPLVDAAFALPPDSGARATALAALFAPTGAAALVSRLSDSSGSPIAAVKAAQGDFAALSADARVIVVASAYGGLVARPELLAAALALSGTTQSESVAALQRLFAGINAGEAWSAGQVLNASCV